MGAILMYWKGQGSGYTEAYPTAFSDHEDKA